jgi:TetR/AcrR family transcriptional regulator
MKKEMKTELTKEKILSAAMKEFGAKGYEGASLNHICETGIAKGLLYHNYENKDALFLPVWMNASTH